MFWRNQDRTLITNGEITEWDIKSGNTSIMREYKLAPTKIIDKIEALPKQQRVIAVGKLMAKDKKFARALEECFDDAVNRFIEQNQIEKTFDVLSIKRDAVYLCNGCVDFPTVGTYVTFVPKNIYHAYVVLNGKEFLFGRDKLDVKGLSDKILPKHDAGIHTMLKDVIGYLERFDDYGAHEYMHELVDAYKKKELPFDYYRTYDDSSMYNVLLNDNIVQFDMITESMMSLLDIRYNYEKIILPFIELLVA